MKEVEKDLLTIEDRIERTNLTNRVQSSISDKLWFNIAYHARGNAITDAKNDKINIRQFGYTQTEYSEAEENKKNEYIESIITDSLSVERAFKELAAIKVKILTAYGEEAEKIQNKLKGNIPDKDKIADIMVKEGGSVAKILVESIDEVETRLLEQSKKNYKMLFDHFGITADTSVGKVLDILGMDEEAKRQFYIENECKKNDSFYLTFDVTETEEEYLDNDIVLDAIDNYLQIESNKILKDFLKAHGINADRLNDISRENNYPAGYLFDAIKLDKNVRQEFYDKYNMKENYPLYTALSEHIKEEHPNYRQEVIDDLKEDYRIKHGKLVDFVVYNYAKKISDEAQINNEDSLNNRDRSLYQRGAQIYSDTYNPEKEIGGSWRYLKDINVLDINMGKAADYTNAVSYFNGMIYSGAWLETDNAKNIGDVVKNNPEQKANETRWINRVEKERLKERGIAGNNDNKININNDNNDINTISNDVKNINIENNINDINDINNINNIIIDEDNNIINNKNYNVNELNVSGSGSELNESVIEPEEPREGIDPEIDSTYAAQNTLSDKLWYATIFMAKEEVLKSKGISFSDDEKEKKKTISNELTGNLNNIKNSFKKLGEIDVMTTVAMGNEADLLEKKIAFSDDKKKAADYSIKTGQFRETYMVKGVKTLERSLKHAAYSRANDILNELKINVNSPVEDIVKALGYDPKSVNARRFTKKFNEFKNEGSARKQQNLICNYYLANIYAEGQRNTSRNLSDADKKYYERGQQINKSAINSDIAGFEVGNRETVLNEIDGVLFSGKAIRTKNADKVSSVFSKGIRPEMYTNFVNEFYKEPNALRGLMEPVNKLEVFLQKDADFYAQNKHFIDNLKRFSKQLASYYRKNQITNEYPMLDNYSYVMLRNKYNDLLSDINTMKNGYITYRNLKNQQIRQRSRKEITNKELRNFDNITNVLSSDLPLMDKLVTIPDSHILPLAMYKSSDELRKLDYPNGTFKYPGFIEYCRIHARDKNVTLKQLEKQFDRLTPQSAASEYRFALKVQPWLYEYLPRTTKIPTKIQNTGNVAEIQDYIDKNQRFLTDQERAFLEKHIEVANRLDNINTIAENKFANNEEYGKKPELIENGPDSVELKMDQPALQTSSQGCWSCVGQMMVASRGGDTMVTQEDIRGYRPKLEHNEDLENHGYGDADYNVDGGKVFMEMSDSILAFAPNTMMREFDILPYSRDIEKSGITSEQYMNNSIAALKKQIIYALKEDKSPIMLRLPGHYVSVIGIDGDTLKYKESGNFPDNKVNQTHTLSLSEYVKNEFITKTNPAAIQIAWMADIKLAADKKTIHGVPSKYVEMNEDGIVKGQPDEIHDNIVADYSVQNRDGIRIYRMSDNDDIYLNPEMSRIGDDGLMKVEKTYLPKKLHADYLKRMADARSIEEEERLDQIDREMFKIDRRQPQVGLDAGNVNVEAGNVQPQAGNDAQPHLAAENAAEAGQNNGTIFADIIAATDELMISLKDASPFYMKLNYTKSDHFTNLKDGIEAINKQAKEMRRGIGNHPPVVDEQQLREYLNNLVQDLNNCIESADKYLNYKSDQMIATPGRRNDTSKKTEQKRIKSAIASLDKLSELKNKISTKYQGKVNGAENKAETASKINDYKRRLIADTKKQAQEASYKDRIQNLSKADKKSIDNMEDLLGKLPQQYNDVLKANTDRYTPVGAHDDMDRFSDKDFAAVSFAALSTKEAVQDMINAAKHTDTLKDFTDNQLRKYYTENLINSVSQNSEDNILLAEQIEASRKNAAKALKDYQYGNKEPLAKLIASGISTIVENYRSNCEYGDAAKYAYLANSEMGQRLFGMMERDPELAKLAESKGLNLTDVKYLKSMEMEGKYINRTKELNAEINNAANWDDNTKLERYTDLMIAQMMKEDRMSMDMSRDQAEEYRARADEMDANKLSQLNKTDEDYKKIVDENFTNNPDYVEIKQKFDNDVAMGNNNPDMKDFFLSGAYESFNGRMKPFIEGQKVRLTSLEDQLLDKFREQLDEMDAKRLAQKDGRVMTREERLNAASGIADQFKVNYERGLKEVQDTNDPEMVEAYKASKGHLVEEYISIGRQYKEQKTILKNVENANNRRIGIQSDIGVALNISRSDLSKTYGLDYQIAEELGKAGQETKLRNRVKEYIKAKEYDKLPAADFNKKIINKKGDNHRTKDIYPDLLQYETDKALNNAVHQPQPVIQNQLQQNQPQAGIHNQPQVGGQNQPQVGGQNQPHAVHNNQPQLGGH
ncbi:hypothetical protein SAMN06297422_10147 [Lachnospiraceae bacterium]|nr:hypothetical protein SAMN06297422_10147 [Lachnospiraceae bacterium]